METALSLVELKKIFPNEWVLLGNPSRDENDIKIVAGVPIYHSKDKKEVCYLGRHRASDFEKVALIFTGEPAATRKITGIFNRVKR